uniref:G protein-coupled receptor 82 n=1 Tax=Leptobrachium leishanense TaxID=445787 RepID=A0A8C5M0M5_9ANUR
MSNNSSCLNPSTVSTIGLPIIYSLMFVPSMFGNFLTLWIFTRYITKKTSTHIYLIHLAISNVLVSSGMPFQITYYANANHWLYNSTRCLVAINASNILTHSSMGMSVLIFCWIAISRYATLVRHIEKTPNATQPSYQKIVFGQILKSFRHPKIAKWLCACLWIVVLSPNVYLSFITPGEISHHLCYNEDVELGRERNQTGALFESICYFVLIVIVLLFYYFFIKHIKDIQANSCIGKKYLIHGTVKRNISVIIVLLVTCFAPYHFMKFILYGLRANCTLRSTLVETKNILLCLAEFRSCSDPVVYLCLDEVFKQKTHRFLSKSTDDISHTTQVKKRNTLQISTLHVVTAKQNEMSLTNETNI